MDQIVFTAFISSAAGLFTFVFFGLACRINEWCNERNNTTNKIYFATYIPYCLSGIAGLWLVVYIMNNVTGALAMIVGFLVWFIFDVNAMAYWPRKYPSAIGLIQAPIKESGSTYKWNNSRFQSMGRRHLLGGVGVFVTMCSYGWFVSLWNTHFQSWERIIFFAFGFVLFYFSVLLIRYGFITHATVKLIEYDNGVFSGKTFGGKSFEFEQSTASVKKKYFPKRMNIFLLFDKSKEYSVVTCSAGKFYLTEGMERVDELIRLIDVPAA